jgi:hypothetical protein
MVGSSWFKYHINTPLFVSANNWLISCEYYLGELLSFFGYGVATLIQRPTVHGSCVTDRGRDDDAAHARDRGHVRDHHHAHARDHDDAAFDAAVAHAGPR